MLRTEARRFAAARVMALALTVPVVLSACGSDSRPAAVAHVALTRTYSDPGGWSIRYPATMHLERSGRTCDQPRLKFTEMTLATFTPRPPVQSRTDKLGGLTLIRQPADSQGRFPRDAVALRILCSLTPMPEAETSTLPLTLASFKAPSLTGAVSLHIAPRETAILRKTMPIELSRVIHVRGRTYQAEVLIGRDAPARTRKVLAAVIASFATTR